MVSLDYETRDPATFAVVTIDRASRANSLVPELVDALNDALGALKDAEIGGVVIRSAGAFFSSGGDVSGFAHRRGPELVEYADHLVGGLQRAVLSLYALPVPVMTRLQGGVTGGAVGLVFSADMIAMDEKAFIQPYYSDVGLAPDGGWTALLAERISTTRAFSIQAVNHRIHAEEALRLGLVNQLAPAEALDAVVGQWLDALASKSPATIRTTKRLLRQEADIERMRSKLDAERLDFMKLIGSPDTAKRIELFLQ